MYATTIDALSYHSRLQTQKSSKRALAKQHNTEMKDTGTDDSLSFEALVSNVNPRNLLSSEAVNKLELLTLCFLSALTKDGFHGSKKCHLDRNVSCEPSVDLPEDTTFGSEIVRLTSSLTPNRVPYLARILCVMKKAVTLCQENRFCTLRQLYYEHVGISVKQAAMDAAVGELTHILKMPRETFGFTSSSKCLVRGSVKIIETTSTVA